MSAETLCRSFKTLQKQDDSSSMNEKYCQSSLESEVVELRPPEFQVHDFRNRSKEYFITIWRIATFIIVFAALIIIGFNFRKVNEPTSTVPPVKTLLFVGNQNSLWSLDVKNTSYNLLQASPNKSLVINTYLNETVIWIEENSTTINSNSKNYPNISLPEIVNVRAFALDFMTEKLYAIDVICNTINIIDLRHNHMNIILSDLINPREILLDPTHGFMFILQYFDSIIRGNMDGNDLSPIVNGSKLCAMTISLTSRKIFWANAYESIESSNYDGTNRVLITKIQSDVSGVAVANDELFWIFSPHENSSSIMFSCDIGRDRCVGHSIVNLPLKATWIESATQSYKVSHDNPCREQNGGCEQLCLLTVNGGHSCACRLGWTLGSDSRSCKLVDQFLLYVTGGYFRGRIIDGAKNSFQDVIHPTPYKVDTLKFKKRIEFDQAWSRMEVFYCDDRSIYRLDLITGSIEKLFQVANSYYIQNLASDHYQENLYILRVSNFTDIVTVDVLSSRQGKFYRKTVMSFAYSYDLGHRTSLVVDSRHSESLYFILPSNADLIKSCTVNGSNDHSFHYEEGRRFNLLAVDRDSQTLYWIDYGADEQDELISIKYGQLGAYDQYEQFQSHMYESLVAPNKMVVYKDWLFVSGLSNIWRFNKHTGDDWDKVLPINHDSEIDGVGVMNFGDEPKGQCALKEDYCEQICFYVGAEMLCDCANGMEARENRCV